MFTTGAGKGEKSKKGITRTKLKKVEGMCGKKKKGANGGYHWEKSGGKGGVDTISLGAQKSRAHSAENAEKKKTISSVLQKPQKISAKQGGRQQRPQRKGEGEKKKTNRGLIGGGGIDQKVKGCLGGSKGWERHRGPHRFFPTKPGQLIVSLASRDEHGETKSKL